MCGRFTLSNPDAEQLAAQFGVAALPDLRPRYNIAPTQPVAAVRRAAGKAIREMALLRWGLVPAWAKDPTIGVRLINARAETAAEKPSFRVAFRRRRCLIVADGFYEWQKQQSGKQPYYIRLRGGRLFAFAGLWERWTGPDGQEIESCTLLTTAPNDLLRPIHKRMPVILHPDDYALWLDPAVGDRQRLQPLLRPYPAAEMEAYPVSRRVNNPRNDDPRCIEPYQAGGPSPMLEGL